MFGKSKKIKSLEESISQLNNKIESLVNENKTLLNLLSVALNSQRDGDLPFNENDPKTNILQAVQQEATNDLKIESIAASKLIQEIEKPLFRSAEDMISSLQKVMGAPDLKSTNEYMDES